MILGTAALAGYLVIRFLLRDSQIVLTSLVTKILYTFPIILPLIYLLSGILALAGVSNPIADYFMIQSWTTWGVCFAGVTAGILFQERRSRKN